MTNPFSRHQPLTPQQIKEHEARAKPRLRTARISDATWDSLKNVSTDRGTTIEDKLDELLYAYYAFGHLDEIEVEDWRNHYEQCDREVP